MNAVFLAADSITLISCPVAVAHTCEDYDEELDDVFYVPIFFVMGTEGSLLLVTSLKALSEFGEFVGVTYSDDPEQLRKQADEILLDRLTNIPAVGSRN